MSQGGSGGVRPPPPLCICFTFYSSLRMASPTPSLFFLCKWTSDFPDPMGIKLPRSHLLGLICYPNC